MLIHILVPTAGQGWGAELARGICDVSAHYPAWKLRLWEQIPTDPQQVRIWWQAHPGDAVVVFPYSVITGGPLHELGVPTVAVGAPDGPLPCVRPDDIAIGRLARAHLTTPGWQPLAVGMVRARWWLDRLQGWNGPEITAPSEPQPTSAWLASLPPRTALFSANDYLAARIAALDVHQRIGRDIRLLGVDDDLPCRMSTPALSSVRIPWRGLGRCAGTMLAELFSGRRVARDILIPPAGIAIRGSTDVLANAEPWMQAIANHLRIAIAKGVDERIDRLLSGCGRSRTTVERAWRAVTGQTLLAYVHYLRTEAILAQFEAGERDIKRIARAVGCHDALAVRRLLHRQRLAIPADTRDV